MPFSIAGRAIALDQPPYLIAEIGVNHNGSGALALQLVEAAAKAGADAVKFQTFSAASVATSRAQQARYQSERASARSQQEMLRALELSAKDLEAAFARASQCGIAAFSTPFDVKSADLLCELGVPALKIGSGDLTNPFLLRRVASAGLPMIVSTGMGTIEEVDIAVAIVRAAGDPPLALLHCLSAYPAPPPQTNLRAIQTLRARYSLEIGFSDHTTGLAVPIAAVALGATIIEKHLTLDRTLPGPDHAASMQPTDLGRLVEALRDAHASLGDGRKRPQPAELDTRRVARRALVLSHDLDAGSVLSAGDLDAKRPEDGLSPLLLDEVIGRRLAHAMAADSPLQAEDLEPWLDLPDANA